jgi:hypothetical protein
VINSLLFGGAEGHAALKQKVESLEMDLGETCSGGCEPWEKSKEGCERFAALRKINIERKAKGLSHV